MNQYLTRDEYWKIFLFFLKQRKVYSLYYKNYNDFYNIRKQNGFIKIRTSYQEWILSAFCWGNTIEGMTFWRHIHEEWLNYIRNIIINGKIKSY